LILEGAVEPVKARRRVRHGAEIQRAQADGKEHGAGGWRGRFGQRTHEYIQGGEQQAQQQHKRVAVGCEHVPGLVVCGGEEDRRIASFPAEVFTLYVVPETVPAKKRAVAEIVGARVRIVGKQKKGNESRRQQREQAQVDVALKKVCSPVAPDTLRCALTARVNSTMSHACGLPGAVCRK
jgi:hypothetical protein